MRSRLFYTICVLVIFMTGNSLFAQESRSVSGMVTAFKQIPVNKVKVSASKSGEVVYTDSLGLFSVKSLDKDVLTFTAAGFDSKKLTVGKKNTYTVDLMYKDNVSNFNNAVSNGHVSENTLRKAIEAFQNKNAKDYSKYNSIYQLVASEIYSVSVRGNAIYNKQVKSFDSNPAVLCVVNDKIVSDISFVNPADVKTIEFIDDVGASLYGSMGANGVLKITLK